jgi:hypothetical protein
VIGYTSHGAATMPSNGIATAQTTPALSMRNLAHLTRASHSIVARCAALAYKALSLAVHRSLGSSSRSCRRSGGAGWQVRATPPGRCV